MNLKHYDIIIQQSYNISGWHKSWHGYYENNGCQTQQRVNEYFERDSITHSQGMITEEEFERDCLISILHDIKTDSVNLFEIGAGWGRVSLSLAGIIDNEVLSVKQNNYYCIAIEAEPTHYEWLKSHFKQIKGKAIFGAVSNKVGYTYFDVSSKPDEEYGQGIAPIIRGSMLPSVGNILRAIDGKSIQVPTLTIDSLISEYKYKHVDIIDIDVQGNEYNVLLGGLESIKKGMIDYFLIGTHSTQLNKSTKGLLCDWYDLVVDILPNSVGQVEGFSPIKCHDGIQLFKRKNI